MLPTDRPVVSAKSPAVVCGTLCTSPCRKYLGLDLSLKWRSLGYQDDRPSAGRLILHKSFSFFVLLVGITTGALTLFSPLRKLVNLWTLRATTTRTGTWKRGWSGPCSIRHAALNWASTLCSACSSHPPTPPIWTPPYGAYTPLICAISLGAGRPSSSLWAPSSLCPSSWLSFGLCSVSFYLKKQSRPLVSHLSLLTPTSTAPGISP